MSRKKKKLIHNILIICEGTITEPQYLLGLKREVIRSKKWTNGIAIDIRPIPKEPEEEEERALPKHKTRRKKRKLKNVSVVDESGVEEKYKAVPTRYVREAQLGLKDGVYDEAWAMYDKDYHPRHREAYELSLMEIEGEKVNIAFSSISFEHWLLLHFERSDFPFVKSECKDGKGRVLDCGTGNHADDCWGGKCIGGYMRTNQYLDFKKNSFTVFKDTFPYLEQAFIHTTWLESMNKPKLLTQPFYELNPYCNVDDLVHHLLQWERKYQYAELNDKVIVDDLELTFFVENNILSIMIYNDRNVRVILGKDAVFNNGNQLETVRKVIPSKDERFISIPIEKGEIRFVGIENHIILLDV